MNKPPTRKPWGNGPPGPKQDRHPKRCQSAQLRQVGNCAPRSSGKPTKGDSARKEDRHEKISRQQKEKQAHVQAQRQPNKQAQHHAAAPARRHPIVMGCVRPITGWFSKTTTKNGKRAVVFNKKEAFNDLPVQIPCGQCIGCRLEKSRQWALRCMHEAQMHEDNCFITLTYNEEHLPFDQGLRVSHFQKFMKRLRKHAQPQKIRFYHCGEYGDKDGRPHYHAALFGYQFDDLVEIPDKKDLFTSPTLEQIWGKGFCTVGHMTFDRAAYIARYCMKKATGKHAEDYEVIDPIDFQVYNIQPPYSTMSRRPGIGKSWYEKFKGDCYPSDFLVMNEKKLKPPKAYDKHLEEEDPELYKTIKFLRAKEAKSNHQNNTTQRLVAREKIQTARLNLKEREL